MIRTSFVFLFLLVTPALAATCAQLLADARLFFKWDSYHSGLVLAPMAEQLLAKTDKIPTDLGRLARLETFYSSLEAVIESRETSRKFCDRWGVAADDLDSARNAFAGEISRHLEQVKWTEAILKHHHAQGELPKAKDFRRDAGPFHVNRDQLFGTGPYAPERRGNKKPIFDRPSDLWRSLQRRAELLNSTFTLAEAPLKGVDTEVLRPILQRIAMATILNWMQREGWTISIEELSNGTIPRFFDYGRLTGSEGYSEGNANYQSRIFSSSSEFWVTLYNLGKIRGIDVDLRGVSVQHASRQFFEARIEPSAKQFVNWWMRGRSEEILSRLLLMEFLRAHEISFHSISTPEPDWDHPSLRTFWFRVRELVAAQGRMFPLFRVRVWGHTDWKGGVKPVVREDVLSYFLAYAKTNGGKLPPPEEVGRNRRNVGFSVRQLLGQSPFEVGGEFEDRGIFASFDEFWDALNERAIIEGVMLQNPENWGHFTGGILLRLVEQRYRERKNHPPVDEIETILTQQEWIALSEEVGYIGRLVGEPSETPLDEASREDLINHLSEGADASQKLDRLVLRLILTLEATPDDLWEVIQEGPIWSAGISVSKAAVQRSFQRLQRRIKCSLGV